MPVYMIFALSVLDAEGFASYGKAVLPLLQKHQGKLLAADLGVSPLEGESQTGAIVIEFPSHAEAEAFYRDPDYASLKQLRLDTSEHNSAVLAKQFVRHV